MAHATIQVLLYGLLAGLSPLAFAATIAATQTGRLKPLGFGAGFVLAQRSTRAVFVIAGVAVTGTTKSHPGIQALLGGALALLLVWAALQVRRRGPRKREGSSERTRALLERLGRFRFLTTIVAGLLLGIGGPKRLVLTAFAATTITVAGMRNSGEAALVVLFVALATALVWGPVILDVLLGGRAVALMTRAGEGRARPAGGDRLRAPAPRRAPRTRRGRCAPVPGSLGPFNERCDEVGRRLPPRDHPTGGRQWPT